MTRAGRDHAVLVGNSDGIGRAVTTRLLDQGWRVSGFSRSDVALDHASYRHRTVDVATPEFVDLMQSTLREIGPALLCIYFAGVGHEFDVTDLAGDRRTFEVNLLGLLDTVAEVVPAMIEARGGHVIALSSLADSLVLPGSVSYPASKLAMSSYLKSLRIALAEHGVSVTNIRFGFVDTKMADAPVRPFMISVDRAADVVLRCMQRRPAVCSYPRRAAVAALLGRGIDRVFRATGRSLFE